MKSFFLLIFGLVLPLGLSAVNISSVYFSSCNRENGVIIHVDENRVQMLGLDGAILDIPRYEIIYMSYYPLGEALKVPEMKEPTESKLYTIKTLHNGEVVDLVSGWLIDHSDDRFSFLSLTGVEQVVDAEDIWDLEEGHPCRGECPAQENKPAESEASHLQLSRNQYDLVHAYPFQDCNHESDNLQTEGKALPKLFPQYLLSDRLLIKTELDRLQEGYDRLSQFEENKKFYPVPTFYSNDTELGFWVNAGSRYGSSKNRNNSFIPFIRSELNEGPFGFQRVFLTGVAPMKNGIHEEPQFQATYSMKSSYVHFDIIIDASRFNIGQEKYKWASDEMETQDDRENEIFSVSGGFDYGSWALDMTIMQNIYYAIRHGDLFHRDDIEKAGRYGIFYRDRYTLVQFYMGGGSDMKPELIPLKDSASAWEQAYIEEYNNYLKSIPDFYTKLGWYRLNVDLLQFTSLLPKYSFIWRDLKFRRENDELNQSGGFSYSSQSMTHVIYLDYSLDEDLKLKGYLSVESVRREYESESDEGSHSKNYPKAGLSAAFLF